GRAALRAFPARTPRGAAAGSALNAGEAERPAAEAAPATAGVDNAGPMESPCGSVLRARARDTRSCRRPPLPMSMTIARYRFGDYVLDLPKHELLHRGAVVALPARVFECLGCLIEHRDR